MTDIKKQFEEAYSESQVKGVLTFFDYVKVTCENKSVTELKLSYEEFDFLKKLVSETLKQMDAMQFKWYNLIKKVTVKMMKTQYREVLKQMK